MLALLGENAGGGTAPGTEAYDGGAAAVSPERKRRRTAILDRVVIRALT